MEKRLGRRCEKLNEGYPVETGTVRTNSIPLHEPETTITGKIYVSKVLFLTGERLPFHQDDVIKRVRNERNGTLSKPRPVSYPS